MRPVPNKSDEKTDYNQTDPAPDPESKKISKTRKPKTPADRNPPQMKVRSTSNKSYVSSFKEGNEKNRQEVVEKKVSVEYEKYNRSYSSPGRSETLLEQKTVRQFMRDESFVKNKIDELWLNKDSHFLSLNDIADKLYELAESANDGGIQMIVEFGKRHGKHFDFLGAFAYRAINDGNAGLFASIRRHVPDVLAGNGISLMLPTLARSSANETEIHQAISVIKMMLKDGADCTEEEMRTLAEWAKQRDDQELAGLLVRDEKFVKRKLEELADSKYSHVLLSKDIENKLYELAKSATDGGIQMIVEFSTKHSKHFDFLEALCDRASREENAGLFERLSRPVQKNSY